ncbi:MAG: 50S ribosomal protein L9 [Gammaproteobacteria bacterium]|nr:MAG: 50S ribosomal protein L9 [Gammaproteobacteria bacterium]
MELILLEKVQNLGELGDKVKVKSGYGRNYLVPSGKATPATPENIARFEQRRAELEKVQAERLGTAEQRVEKLRDVSVTIQAKAGNEGKLYGSVGTREIAEAVNAIGIELEKHEVLLPEGALRETGEHEVALHLHSDIDVSIKVIVEAEE